MKKIYTILLTAIISVGLLSSCAKNAEKQTRTDTNKISVVSTIFPGYDFAMQIAGDNATVTMLLPSGSESHSYEPTAQDIIKIQNCDLFIYVGGENDTWVDKILLSFEKPVKTLRMLDCVTAVEEEITPEMQVEEDKSEGAGPEYDEHVWTSPQNAIQITQDIADALSEFSPENADSFQQNASAYIEKLNSLDKSFRDFFETITNKVVIFADRFPMRYFTDAYGLDYFAAFPGCAGETEPSPATVAFLTDKVKEENIEAIYYIELSNHQIADSIAEATGTQERQINTCHNVTKAQFDAGVTYLSLMEENLQTFKETMK